MQGDDERDQAGAAHDRLLADSSADELIETAFPSDPASSARVSCRRVFALIPGEAFSTTPEEFSAFLEGIFDTEEDLDAVLDRCLSPHSASQIGSLTRRVRALVPPGVLGTFDPSSFVDEIFNAFDEIDEVLASLNDDVHRRGGAPGATMAIVPEEVIADPQELIRVIDRMQSDAEKLDLLLRQARHALKRLRVYRLTRRAPGQLLNEMRQADHIPTLQYVIDFLSSILQAADSFEKIELPRPHIRDYLEFLYRMENWGSLADLVSRLQEAVERYSKKAG